MVFFITATLNALANPVPAPSNMPWSPDAGQDEDPGASIDQSVLWLLITGLVFGVLFIQKNLRKQVSQK